MIQEINVQLMKNLFVSAAHHLDNQKQEINDLNVFPVPDGDTGTNMSMTMLAAERALVSKEFASAGEVVSCVASQTLRGARGNSGVILSQIMRGFATALSTKEAVTAADLSEAFSQASKTAYRAVMKPTEGTILTVIRCIAETMESLDEDDDVLSFFEAVVTSGNEALSNTPKMLPVLKNAGVVDAGGKGLMVILEGMFESLKNDGVVEEITDKDVSVNVSVSLEKTEVSFGYCTEFLICKENSSASGEAFKKMISGLGDSVLVIDDVDIIKVHIHTDHPGEILEKALSFGSLSDVKIDNLREQAEERKEAVAEPLKKYGIISVAAGEGICALMQDMGVDYIVSGGQTMNPSAEDILEAVRTIRAEKIFVLPNNSNIVLTAEQAADMTDKDVQVIKTKTIPQGIAALMAFDGDADDVADQMQVAANMVQTGLLTNAVRDTDVNGLTIHKGDFLALSGGDIIAAGDDETFVMRQMFDALLDEEKVAITLLYGENVTEEEASVYEDILSADWPDIEVSVIYGGQPVYRYILSVE